MSIVTYGDFDYVPDGLIPEAQFDLSISPIDLTTHWQRCGEISDMVAGYIACAHPMGFISPESSVYSAMSTITQEVIENAARYSRQRGGVITIRIKHYNRVVRIEVENETMVGLGELLERHIETLFNTDDLDAMHLDIIESSLSGEQHVGSGLLLLIKDYPVKLGARLIRDNVEYETVIVRAYYHMEMSEYDLMDDASLFPAPLPRFF